MNEDIVKIYDIPGMEVEEARKQWRDFLRGSIHNGVVEVKFIKKDNTLRTMNCTTNFDEIEKEYHPKPDAKERKIDKDKLCNVFDIDAKGWRSFNFESVVSFAIQEYRVEYEEIPETI